MGFIQAISGAVGGTLADQWKDYFGPGNLSNTFGVAPAQHIEQNRGRGSNTKASQNIITNGSRVIVPEGLALLTVENGKITNYIDIPGGYEFRSDDQNSKSIFAGDGIFSSLIKSSWERFKFGGIPAQSQAVYYVNLKEIPNQKFGTQSEIYWFDAYLNAQVGAVTRGTYTLKIVDPISFVVNFVPATYLTQNRVFDFSDLKNDASTQLFNEVVGSLSQAFSIYINDSDKNHSMMRLQSDTVGFAQSLGQAVEDNYQWKENRGLTIEKATLIALEYDQDTKKVLADVKRADALTGNRGNSFLQQSLARGIQSAGENGSDSATMFGLGVGGLGQLGTAFTQPTNQQHTQVQSTQTSMEEITNQLLQAKKLLDAEAITQEEYDALKSKLLS